MTTTRFFNAQYFGEDLSFHHGGFEVADGRIQKLGEATDGIDLNGGFVIPGLIDIHTHGNSGYDFSACGTEELRIIASAHARNGVAGFCPTSMSLPEDTLAEAFSNAAALAKAAPPDCARVLGVNMEGPFIDHANKGAQNEKHIAAPDIDMFERLQKAANGNIKIVCAAPELPGADKLAEALRGSVVVSAAHTSADYLQAAHGFDSGFSHVTHLFNAMTPFRHRTPGILGASAERPHVTVELIADGIHLHPSTVRMAFALYGAERICLISDSMEACGMPDGMYMLGGQQVRVKGQLATLADDTIAGATTPLIICMRNAIEYGIPKEAAVRAASYNPAKLLGVEDEYGCIADGRRADFVICDDSFAVRQVYLGGKLLA